MQLNTVLFVAVLFLGIASAVPVSEPSKLDKECPDKKSSCSNTATCCVLTSGEYGCCKLSADALCCPDKIHCCPHGYTCDPQAKGCKKGEDEVFPMEKISYVSSVTCADGSSCPDGDTCCHLPGTNSSFGCCPLTAAVCCSDGLHCCPVDYACNKDGTCTTIFDKIVPIPMLAKIPAKSPTSVVCPDGQTQCPAANTCCKLSSGQYGCCPMPEAVCCSDNVHCCPNGYTCDVSAGTCTKQDHSIAFLKKTSGYKSTDIVCPNSIYSCPSGETCCPEYISSAYGCCPYSNAVCCSDGEHCCPSGYTCIFNSCRTTVSLVKISVMKPENVVCPDGQSECPDGNTCCKLSSGQWGCCPFPNAMCCSDGQHCCPSGYTCDISAGTCTKLGHTIAFFEKISVRKPQSKKFDQNIL